MELTTLWFGIIAVLWIGYFVLDGFDLGIGTLLPFLAKGEGERRLLVNTIGPVWDGNEVWVLTAGGAMFAAFPLWYATLFSGFYLALFLILLALIVRGVAFEYRAKRDEPSWSVRWDAMIFLGSAVPALLWGVAFGNIVRGTKIDEGGDYVGSFWDLLNPYALLGGLTTLGLFVTHGAIYAALKTDGPIRTRARTYALGAGLATAVFAVAFLLWSQAFSNRVGVTLPLSLAAAVAFVGALYAVWRTREGWAFIATAATLGLAVAALFTGLYPNVMPSSLNDAWSLTTTNASSQDYTLTVMTWVAVIFTPVVLVYQSWTFWVFRRRLRVEHVAPAGTNETVPAS